MNSKAMSLKARIRKYAADNHIAAQVVLQNYMFERFLNRLFLSPYKNKFVIKGGILIATIVGLDTRSTMDLDTTLKDLPLTKEQLFEALTIINEIDLEDGVFFQIVSIDPIRKDDEYGGFRVRINAVYDTITTPLSIDISTGDIITPSPVLYSIDGMFDENIKMELWGYNIETIMAEKIETILSRGVFNTRPRDYYDVYILATTQQYNQALLEEALEATCLHRQSVTILSNHEAILQKISENLDLKTMWVKYAQRFPYASNISFESIVAVLDQILHSLYQ